MSTYIARFSSPWAKHKSLATRSKTHLGLRTLHSLLSACPLANRSLWVLSLVHTGWYSLQADRTSRWERFGLHDGGTARRDLLQRPLLARNAAAAASSVPLSKLSCPRGKLSLWHSGSGLQALGYYTILAQKGSGLVPSERLRKAIESRCERTYLT